MGNFNDNHDNARFLSSVVNSGNSSLSASAKLTQFKSLTAFTLTASKFYYLYKLSLSWYSNDLLRI